MPEDFTPLDATHAYLIGVLLCNAKLVQFGKKLLADPNARQHPEKLYEHLMQCLNATIQLCQGDGKRMEQDTIALAAHLGFVIEQHYVAQSSGGVH